MRHALTLTLALAVCPAAATPAPGAREPSARAHATHTSLAAPDGVARPAKRHGASARRRAAVGKTGRVGAGARAASQPVVTEIDSAGLSKLLDRGGDPAKARPLLVNFWATWCDPCREEFPDLVKLDAEFRDRGLDFVTVSADDISEIKSGVPKFLSSMGARMPAYLLNAADTEKAIGLVDRSWGGELPATFLFDREGKIAYQHKGRIKPDELRAALEKVLAAK